MDNVIPARGQVTEKFNAIIAGVCWIGKEKVAANFIPINLQNMKYLAAGVRGCEAFCARIIATLVLEAGLQYRGHCTGHLLLGISNYN